MTHYANSLLCDLERARDVVQETFLRYWQADLEKIAEYEKPWLFRVCRNLCLDTLKREKRTVVEADLSQRSAPDADDTEERLQAILGVLSELPEKQQEVVRLKYQYDMSYKEIAEVTGHSVSNVGFIMHTALKTLKEKLGISQARAQEQT